MQLRKELPITTPQGLTDIPGVIRFLEGLIEHLKTEHRQIRNDLLHIQPIVRGEAKIDGSWRFDLTGGYMEFQERVSGVWEMRGAWKARG